MVEDCDRSADPYRGGARGWCGTHYMRWKRHGDPLHGGPVLRQSGTGQPCEFCAKPVVARGYCENHYRRWKRCGDPLGGRTAQGLPDDVRFWAKVEKTDTCWLWTGSLNSAGYGGFSTGPTRDLAHRWAYAHEVGPIPEGLDLDHLCRVKRCVNPAHLEAVTRAENLRRAREASRG